MIFRARVREAICFCCSIVARMFAPMRSALTCFCCFALCPRMPYVPRNARAATARAAATSSASRLCGGTVEEPPAPPSSSSSLAPTPLPLCSSRRCGGTRWVVGCLWKGRPVGPARAGVAAKRCSGELTARVLSPTAFSAARPTNGN